MNLDPCITRSFSFQSRTYDRYIRTDKWNSLALHVRSHQGTVSVIVLKERDQ